ncbi:MAG: GH116 [uncultured Thermomicrobiales bacterium]|uniref:GH116 n=1 Tax=uncultured Thermomicrobiales bacterium TaxID=1645740 RepID=A0A6J4VAE5_9BACT|nr:MAG: GH116 [uncultured Thermomicrobiales bacterium]
MATATTAAPKVYRGDALRAAAMPLGGLGTGTIALAGDGSLRQWQIHNQVNHVACVPHSFFAVWSRSHRPPDEPIARVLQSAALYDAEGPPAPPTSNDHVVPIPHRRLLAKLPGVRGTELVGGYPIAELRYEDDALPLRVSLEAFNPFIPLQSKDSGLPAILFNLRVENPSERVQLASVAATLQNAVGWDGIAPIFDTRSQLYGGNVNALVRVGDMTALSMGNAWLPADDPRAGTMVLAVRAPEATHLTQWADLGAFWDDFAADGRLANTQDSTPSAAGRTWNGALAVPMTLQPGEARTVAFTLAWYFPNRHVNYSQSHYFNFEDDKSKFWLGNRYNRWFRSALDVATYVEEHRDRLSDQTRLARDTFYDTTLPAPLIEAVGSQMSIARTPTCFWVEDGTFYGFEGCNGASTPHNEPVGGCCPLNCTHVWNYEMALARLYPDLERTMRDVEWDIQQHPSGYLPHRVLLPTYLPRIWDREIGGPANPALDGLLGAILKTYREYLAGGDEAWLDRAWPSVKQALEHVWSAHDRARAGIIEGEQPNTYDISIYGANTFVGTLYLASLRAVEELARRRGEGDLAGECRAVFERGREAHERRLWNGEYYVQEVDLERYPEQNWATGCHADHLLGQWWAHLLGLGHLLDPEHVRTAAKAIVAHNFRANFRDVDQKPRAFATDDDRGLLLCTWPRGGRPAVPTQYSDEVWTGIEYEVAGLLLQEGEPELALQVLAAVRDRYDGRKQNPWNDIECGDHYVRAMSSWGLLEAASGYAYDAGTNTIGFAPAISPGNFRAPFVARDGWGRFSQTEDDDRLEARLRISAGTLAVARVRLRPGTPRSGCAAEANGRRIPARLVVSGRDATVVLDESTSLGAGQELSLVLVAGS